MNRIDSTVAMALRGRHVSLEPLDPGHSGALGEAAADGELWQRWYTSVPRSEAVDDYIATALAAQAAGSVLAFAVRDASGTIVGTTRYYDIDRSVPRLSVGYTWYAQRVHRTGLNTEAKLLLLEHAFEVLGCIAVGFETSWFNHASRAAIARLGAKQDGILRSHRRHADGSVRDTVVFSILDNEWPAVRAHLQSKLSAHG